MTLMRMGVVLLLRVKENGMRMNHGVILRIVMTSLMKLKNISISWRSKLSQL
jgi:hypothetical protein